MRRLTNIPVPGADNAYIVGFVDNDYLWQMFRAGLPGLAVLVIMLASVAAVAWASRSSKDPRRLVAEALSYLRNNEGRMDYPRYRQQGLPVTSSLAESLVGEFNARLKSKQKYWDRPGGAEAILQLRAAVLSEDDRLARFFAQRPGNPYRRKAS